MNSLPIFYNGKRIIEIKNRSKTLMLTWIINNICTNKCSYCPKDLHTGTNHHYDWKHAENFIKECFRRYGDIQCNLSGGEPTVSPFFKDLVNLIYDLGGSSNLTTNLVRNKTYWEDIADKFNGISVSYHPEFMNSTLEEEFIDKLQYLGEKTYVTIRVMMHPKYWDQCLNFYQRIIKLDFNYFAEIVRILPNYGIGDPFCDIQYTPEQEKILNTIIPKQNFKPMEPGFRHNKIDSVMVFEDNTSKLLHSVETSVLENTKQNNFYKWSCNIGLESLFVHYNGNVQRGNCAVGGSIGNITTSVEWPTTSIVCNKDECHCIADLLMSKKSI
jgi:MoaA/NifB/PqqE/SkfB family radical SAM enzyme